MCIPLSMRQPTVDHPLNILLTNGRFPVSVDLARQLKLLGHNVSVLDPMHYHVCKFSAAVRKSYQVPAPRVDRRGFISATLRAIEDGKIDYIIGMHEEFYYLAQSQEPEIVKRLIAPDWPILLRLHNKWEFSKVLEEAGLDRPRAWLCRNIQDAKRLDRSVELALKPVFGRASSNVYHLKPGDPEGLPEGLEISEEEEYIAQEWLYGNRYCCYTVIREQRVDAIGVYPVEDTIDGSSCVYFRSVEHPGILAYVQKLAAFLPRKELPFQASFDFIETTGESSPQRLVAIECNPRATSGIHLFSGTPALASALTATPAESPIVPRPGAKRQLAPGMMMWKKSERGAKAWLRHMKRLMGSKDVIFNKRDIGPSLMQPFLLTSYYEICREQKRKLPDMFQWELCWIEERPPTKEEAMIEGLQGKSMDRNEVEGVKKVEIPPEGSSARRDSGKGVDDGPEMVDDEVGRGNHQQQR